MSHTPDLTIAHILVLGWLRKAYNVGLYTIAAKIAFMTSFFLTVTNTAVAPKVASLYDAGDVVLASMPPIPEVVPMPGIIKPVSH